MKKLACLLIGVLTLVSLSPLVQARIEYQDSFESYISGTNIAGQPVGATTWSVAGVLAGDLAIVSGSQAYGGDGGGNSLYLSQTVTGNRPRASVNLISGSFIPSAISAGSVTFAVCEDPNNSGVENLYTVNIGNISLSRTSPSKFAFSVTGGGSDILYFTTSNYTYTTGSWNVFNVVFDNVAKAAQLYINGGFAGTITGTAADFSVSGITLGLYSSSSTSDKVYFDALSVNMLGYNYENNLDTYTPGTSVSGLTDGSSHWTAYGLTTGQIMNISNAYSLSSSNSMMITQVPGNRPRASLNFVSGSFIPAAAAGGTVGFSVLEAVNSGTTVDSFTVNIGNYTVTRDPTKNVIVFSMPMTSGTTTTTYSLNFPFQTDDYTYTSGTWNNLSIAFDNPGQMASLYINGGYAGSLVAQPGSPTSDFTVGGLTVGTYSSSSYSQLYFDNLNGDFNGATGTFPWRSKLYPANWNPNPPAGTTGYTDSEGHFLHDFSYAGYHSGTIPVPFVTTNIVDVTSSPLLTLHADNTGATDSTAAIQAALDYVGTHGGGVAYLPSGTYCVAPPAQNLSGSGTCIATLRITNSNVVLRGAGNNQTYILNTQPIMRNQAVVSVCSKTAIDWFADNSSTHTTPLTADVTTPTTTIPVTSTSAFSVGDLIMVRNDLSTAFIHQLGMDGKPNWTSGNHSGLVMDFCRRITAIDAVHNTLTIDVPVRYPLLTNATDPGANARVTKPVNPMIQEVGIENLSIGMVQYNPAASGWGDDDYTSSANACYYVAFSSAMNFYGAENCWVNSVNSFQPPQNVGTTNQILSSGIWLTNSRFVTVQSGTLGYSQYMGNGGNGYVYALECQECLIQNCTAQYGRHNFSFDMMQSAGNVVQSCTASHSRNSSDFHQYLSPANLIDNITLDHETFEGYFHTAGTPMQGWTTTQSVFWNANGLAYGNNTDGSSTYNIIRADDFGYNYIIGTRGPAAAVRGSDYIEGVGQGTKLIPQSLYLDQRKKRLGF